MENFDFKIQNTLPVLFFYRLKAKKLIFSNIFGNLVLSTFILVYVYQIFTFRKHFMKYMMLTLEMFNVLITLLFISIYIRLSGISNRQCYRIISFYFYYNMFYLFLYSLYTFVFFVMCLHKKVIQVKLSGWAVDEIIIIFIPLMVLFVIKCSQQTNYYYALKKIESS